MPDHDDEFAETGGCDMRDEIKDELRLALKDLLDEVVAAGFLSNDNYGWPRVIEQARNALARAEAEDRSDARSQTHD
jgi:hypothetical protein